jgi:hypothetical protein
MDEHDPGTGIARRHGLVESRMRGDTHVRFGGAGRGTRSSERAIPRPGPTLLPVVAELQVRWDRDSGRWFAFVLVACALVCFKRALAGHNQRHVVV